MGLPFDGILNPAANDTNNFQFLDSFHDSSASTTMQSSSGSKVGVIGHGHSHLELNTNNSPALLSDDSPSINNYPYYHNNNNIIYTPSITSLPMQSPHVSKITSPSSSSTSSSGPRSSTKEKDLHPPETAIKKRTLNTLAARRYRQRRLDQVSELEEQLKETKEERDGLKNRVARLEGELDVLRRLVGAGAGGGKN